MLSFELVVARSRTLAMFGTALRQSELHLFKELLFVHGEHEFPTAVLIYTSQLDVSFFHGLYT